MMKCLRKILLFKDNFIIRVKGATIVLLRVDEQEGNLLSSRDKKKIDCIREPHQNCLGKFCKHHESHHGKFSYTSRQLSSNLSYTAHGHRFNQERLQSGRNTVLAQDFLPYRTWTNTRLRVVFLELIYLDLTFELTRRGHQYTARFSLFVKSCKY